MRASCASIHPSTHTPAECILPHLDVSNTTLATDRVILELARTLNCTREITVTLLKVLLGSRLCRGEVVEYLDDDGACAAPHVGCMPVCMRCMCCRCSMCSMCSMCFMCFMCSMC
jgi:hypothetical protein